MIAVRARRNATELAGDVTAFAWSCASLAVSSTMAAPSLRLVLTASGRQHLLQDAPADTMTLVVLQGGLVVVSAAATLVLGAALVADVVVRNPRSRLARWMPAPVRRGAEALARYGLATGAVVAALVPQPRSVGAAPVASTSATGTTQAAGPDEPPVAVMAKLAPGEAAPPSHAVLRRLDPAPTTPPVTPAATSTPADPAPPAAPAEDTDQAWVVSAGDSFWSIAEEALGEALDRSPTEAETSAYWQHLIAANRERLPVPASPDILHVGQTLVLPPVP